MAHQVLEVRRCCWWRFSQQDLWFLSRNTQNKRRRAAEISQSVSWLRNVSHFVALPINLTHSDTLAQVKEGSSENPLQKTPPPTASTISVSLRLAQFSRNHAPRLILSVHRQA